jgi:hypothetical protein
VPEVVDLLVLGEEAVAAEVEAVAVGVDDGLGDAADLVVGLEDDDLLALLGQQVAGGQAGGAAADDHERALVLGPVEAVRANGLVGLKGREVRGGGHGPSIAARERGKAGALTLPNSS